MLLLRRPLILSVVVVLAAGCSGVPDADKAREAAVVEVAGATLDGATLERWLLDAPAMPSPATAAVLVSAFIEGALVGDALRQGQSLDDSATTVEAIIPDAIRGTILDEFAVRARQRPVPSDAAADSLAGLGGTRVFQHILLTIDWPRADSNAQRARGLAAQALLQRIQAGEDFTAVARAVSEDTATAARGGYLPAIRRSDLPDSRFATVAWALQPGEVSEIVASPVGIHLLRRPPVREVRDQFKAWLAPRFSRRADSLWVDSLSQARQLMLAANAADRARAAAEEPVAMSSDAPLATWEGGNLSARDVERWVALLPPVERVALMDAPDSAASLFVRELAQRHLAYQVITGDTGITTRAWEALAPQYRTVLAVVREEMRPMLADGDPSAAAKAYVLGVTTGGQRYRPLPGGLAGALRARAEVTVKHDAIEAIIAAARPTWLERRAADSTSGAPAVPAAPVAAPAADSATPLP